MRQTQALRVMMDGYSVFLTGAPGAGKSYTLREFVRQAAARGKRVAITASTGIAATHIGGTTIHSWSGLKVRNSLSEGDVAKFLANDRLVKRYMSTDVLVVDEVSMLPGQMLNMLNRLCKAMRDSDEPFGGLQVVLVGDMFQLPPVVRDGGELLFAHQTDAWAELRPKICYLSEQHRQGNDGLLSILEAMRAGDITDEHRILLARRLRLEPPSDQAVTRLYAHNADVDTINARHLGNLPGASHVYRMTAMGSKARIESLQRSLLAPEVLELKIGAEVMFVANDFAKGFVNGSRGRVVEFRDGFPRVELVDSGRVLRVEPHTWSMVEDGKVKAEAEQLPLRLAWAITIHKSQGMSLDAAEVDLSRTFTPGMGYVALSRVRSLDGIYLKGANRMALAMHPSIFELDTSLRSASSELAAVVEDFVAEQVADSAPVEVAKLECDAELLEKLRAWRTQKSHAASLPPYVIAHNTVLEEISAYKPTDRRALMAIKGIGKAKLDAHGTEILEIVVKHI